MQPQTKITDGILEGFEALFEGSAQQRTYALLEIIGRKVKVPMKSIQPAHHAPVLRRLLSASDHAPMPQQWLESAPRLEC